MRATLMSVWRSTGLKPKELETPPCPEGMDYLWEIFFRMRPDSCLRPVDVVSWCQLYGVELLAVEVDVLFRLDDVRLEVLRRHNERRSDSQ